MGFFRQKPDADGGSQEPPPAETDRIRELEKSARQYARRARDLEQENTFLRNKLERAEMVPVEDIVSSFVEYISEVNNQVLDQEDIDDLRSMFRAHTDDLFKRMAYNGIRITHHERGVHIEGDDALDITVRKTDDPREDGIVKSCDRFGCYFDERFGIQSRRESLTVYAYDGPSDDVTDISISTSEQEDTDQVIILPQSTDMLVPFALLPAPVSAESAEGPLHLEDAVPTEPSDMLVPRTPSPTSVSAESAEGPPRPEDVVPAEPSNIPDDVPTDGHDCTPDLGEISRMHPTGNGGEQSRFVITDGTGKVLSRHNTFYEITQMDVIPGAEVVLAYVPVDQRIYKGFRRKNYRIICYNGVTIKNYGPELLIVKSSNV